MQNIESTLKGQKKNTITLFAPWKHWKASWDKLDTKPKLQLFAKKKREKEVLHINQVHPGTEDGRVEREEF